MSTPRLLIVDDEPLHLKALCDTLVDQGYVAVGCGSAAAALEALRQEAFDLLLTDLKMDDMDGIALLRAAREVDPHLVGLMMTGHGTIGTAVAAMQCGALDYILKPFKLSVILPVLSRALAVRKLRLENEALQRSIRERTAELEAVNRELDAFAYSVSHDLRAPLRAVGGYLEMLLAESGELPARSQELIQSVKANAARMGDLIEGLLQLSRASRSPLARQEVKVAALVKQVLEEVRKEAPERPVEVRVGELPDCVGDPTLLRQVFTNLLGNAFKYSRDRARPEVEIGIIPHNSTIAYYVKDNGAGFDMKYAGKLFGAFQRLHRIDEFEGTGIGLSIVHRIITRHGGEIWPEASPDKGAAFYFTLG
ncbi:MAG: response regulator [Chthoniobacteraceae bacterium]